MPHNIEISLFGLVKERKENARAALPEKLTKNSGKMY